MLGRNIHKDRLKRVAGRQRDRIKQKAGRGVGEGDATISLVEM